MAKMRIITEMVVLMFKLYHNFVGGGLIYFVTYARVRSMKKIYNLFSWVVIINLMLIIMPFKAVMANGLHIVKAEMPSEVDNINGDFDINDAGDDVDSGDGLSDDVEYVKNELPILYIRAVNPGYKVDGINNIGEMIEIGKNSDDLVSLAGVTVRYTNSSGNETVLAEFPENGYLAGETFILRLDSSPQSELSNMTYDTTLALKAGPIMLMVGEEVVDSVCWTNKTGCVKDFSSSKPTTLVRNLETGEFEHREEYEPEYEIESYMVMMAVNDGEEQIDETEDSVDVDRYGGTSGGGNIGDDSLEHIDEVESESINDVEYEEYEEEQEENEDADGSRNVTDFEEALDEYEQSGDETAFEEGGNDGDGSDGETVEKIRQCVGIEFSEILSYFADEQAEQFIEFRNVGASAVQMDKCLIRYKSKTYGLAGEVGPGEYIVRWVDDFKLTKNPTSSNVLELLDVNGEVVDVVEYYHGQKKGAAWALVGYDGEEEIWRTTYAVTPGEVNIYQEYKSCEEGKAINEATGYCVKVENGGDAVTDDEVSDVMAENGAGEGDEDGGAKGVAKTKVCAGGQYLNPLTGRCKKLEDEAEEKVCADGYYLNEETGRCRKVVVEEVKTCDEGYYLNEETGRCRKIVKETIKTCADGYYLNEETGRCRKIVVEEEKTCAEGQYLNPLTGRCKKIAAEEEKVCEDGYYLNEETGRCKKIVKNDGADYEIKAETYEEKSSFVALYALLAVVSVGLIYILYEFRREIKRFWRRIFRRK